VVGIVHRLIDPRKGVILKIHWVVRCEGFISGDCILEVKNKLSWSACDSLWPFDQPSERLGD